MVERLEMEPSKEKALQKSPLKLVILVYENGATEYLEGEDARNWSDTIVDFIFHNQMRGRIFPKFPWVVVQIEEIKRLFFS